MAKKSNPKIEDIMNSDSDDDGLDPTELADDLIVEGGDDLTKGPPENIDEIEIEEDLDLSDEGLEDLGGLDVVAEDTDDPYADDFFPYSSDDDSDSF